MDDRIEDVQTIRAMLSSRREQQHTGDQELEFDEEMGEGVLQEDDEEEEEEEEEEIVEEYESSSPSTTTSAMTWISWFCSRDAHQYFCEVQEDFIEDDFNLTGLSALVPFYKEAMEMILDVEPDEESLKVPDVSIVESSAELLYGLIHQRFIITRQGLQQMYAKYDAGDFGYCPRVYCHRAKLLPCGRSDLPGVDTVKLFCASCLDMYTPPSSRFSTVDGAFFGTTFPHLLLQTYPAIVPFSPRSLPKGPTEPSERTSTSALTSASKVYQPRIYGFRVSERARSGPRMQWMRTRPRYADELDWTQATGVAPRPGGVVVPPRQEGLFDDDVSIVPAVADTGLFSRAGADVKMDDQQVS